MVKSKPKPEACYTKLQMGNVVLIFYREKDPELRAKIKRETGREFLLAAYPEEWPAHQFRSRLAPP